MPDIQKALNEATTTSGGYMVPKEFARKVYEKIMQLSIVPPVLEQVNMKYDAMYFPTVTTGSTAYWVAEGATITTQDLAFGRITLTTKKIAALTTLSSELLDDSDPAVAEVILNQMARDLALEIDKGVLRGDGSTQLFTGFTEDANVQKVTAAATTGDALTLAKIADAVSAVEQYNFHPTHIFIHPRSVNVLRKLTDSNGNFIMNEVQFGSPLLKENVMGTVWGLKVVPTTALRTDVTKSTTTTATDIVVLTENYSGLLGWRRDLQANKFYDISTDSWKIQTNMRAAFAVKYPKSVCIIEDILV